MRQDHRHNPVEQADSVEPVEHALVEKLLAFVQKHFYNTEDSRKFYEDRRMLIYAITWPATWLHERGLETSPRRYEELIQETLNDIVAHGDPTRYGPYLPGYLLKCLQDRFRYHGDELCDELKHIRNHLYSIEQLIAAIHEGPPEDSERSIDIEVMAKTHNILKHQNRRRRQTTNATQLTFF